MAKRAVKVKIPRTDPNEIITLCEEIYQKHTDDGANSPLTPIDMADFNQKTIDAKSKLIDAKKWHGQGETATMEAERVLGIGKGQNVDNPGTVYSITQSAKNLLLVVHKANPENLNDWGFNVVVTQTGGRRNVRVDIPRSSPEDLAALAKSIEDKHVADGANSPLNVLDMTTFSTKLSEAKTNIALSDKLHGDAEAKNQEARVIIGIEENQSTTTEGTLVFVLTQIRDFLLVKYKGIEENLNAWGFEVVVS